MSWISIFITDFFANFGDIWPVILVLSIITLVGGVFYSVLFGEKRISVLIPGGAVFGTASFIFYLGILSYLFKGVIGIWIIFILFILTGLFLFFRKKIYLKLPFIRIRSYGIFRVILVFLIFMVIVVKGGNTIFGGDVLTYWGFGTSFSNGNYPQVLPWQPQYLTVHHQGAFLFEGAIHAISGVDIRVVHFLFATFIISGGFFLIWSYLFRHRNNFFASMFPSLLGYITFGGIFIVLPLALGLISPTRSLVELPTVYHAKNSLGAMSSFLDLHYIIPRTVAFALIILTFILVDTKFAWKDRKKFLVLAAISAVTLSVDVSMFAITILPIFLWIVYGFFRSRRKNVFLLNAVISAVLFVILFWVIGNSIRDSILTPSPEAPRFRLIGAEEIIKQNRLSWLREVSFTPQQTPGFTWYIPDLRIIILFVLLSVFAFGGVLSRLFALSSLGALFLFLFTYHTFWPSNTTRFLLMSYQFSGFALGAVIHNLFSNFKNKKVFRLIGFFLVFLVLPSIISSSLRIIKSLPSAHYSNFYPIDPGYTVLKWIRRNLSYETRVFFVDGFLHGEQHSDLWLKGIQNYGLFVPTASSKVKMHTAEWGIESIDVVNSLSPGSLKALKVEYLFVKNDQITRFSVDRLKDINNGQYFEKIYEDELGVLYDIKQSYFAEASEEDNLIASLPELVPEGSRIFLDTPPDLNYYIRAASFLALKDRDLYSVWGPGHYNYIETFITIKDPSEVDKYDYLLLGPDNKAPEICINCDSLEKIWETEQAALWKTI